jgi:hypothetical protein
MDLDSSSEIPCWLCVYNVQCCTVQCSAVQCYALLYSAVLYIPVLSCAAQYCSVLYTLKHGTYSLAQSSAFTLRDA